MANITRDEILKKYVSDMHAVIDHVQGAFERQMEDSDVQANSEANAIISQVNTVLRNHHSLLERHSKTIGAEPHSMAKEALTSVTGLAVGLYDKIRSHPVSKMLRDDYVAMTMCCVAYEMLHTTGLALKDQATADLALTGLKDLTPMVTKIGQAIPAVVTKELAKGITGVDMSAAAVAARNNEEAWRVNATAA